MLCKKLGTALKQWLRQHLSCSTDVSTDHMDALQMKGLEGTAEGVLEHIRAVMEGQAALMRQGRAAGLWRPPGLSGWPAGG